MRTFSFGFKAMLLAFGLAAVSFACSKDDDDDNNTPATPTISQKAAQDADLSVFVQVLEATGLTATLNDNSSKFTVFAPTNAAFTQLLTDLGVANLTELVAAVGIDAVREIVKYHVIGAEVRSSAVTTGYVNTLGVSSTNHNLSMFIDASNGVKLNNKATVTTVDILASNGVIHKIDKVLLLPTILDLVAANSNYSSLAAAVTAAAPNIAASLADNSVKLTLFAPTNAAFSAALTALNFSSLQELVTTLGVPQVSNILLYHGLNSQVRAAQVTAGIKPTLLPNANITIQINGSTVEILDGAGRLSQVTATDIQAVNGVIHSINGVLLPQ